MFFFSSFLYFFCSRIFRQNRTDTLTPRPPPRSTHPASQLSTTPAMRHAGNLQEDHTPPSPPYETSHDLHKTLQYPIFPLFIVTQQQKREISRIIVEASLVSQASNPRKPTRRQQLTGYRIQQTFKVNRAQYTTADSFYKAVGGRRLFTPGRGWS